MERSTFEQRCPTFARWHRSASPVLEPAGRMLAQARMRLSVRVMMALVLVLGTWLGLFVRNVRQQREAVAAVKNAGGSVTYDVEWRNEGFNPYQTPWTPMRLVNGRLWGSKWMIDRIGIDYFGSVVTATLIASSIKSPSKANDATLAMVGRLSRLNLLRLGGTDVTDSGLIHLAGLSSLENLSLRATPISDEGLRHLQGLTRLRELDLGGTPVTDAGMAHLWHLADPRLLMVDGTRISDEALLDLELRFPQLQIIRDEDMALYAKTPRALKDLDFARSQAVRLASMLLARRANVMANNGNRTEAIATAKAVCSLDAHDITSLLKLADACAECAQSLEKLRPEPSDHERADHVNLCIARAASALSLAIDLGFPYEQQLQAERAIFARHPSLHLRLVTDKLEAIRSTQ